ncbi:hypothetical protein GWI33_017963 [Rhynchophorus ferrugineus]|uniref:Uncharacterized protein n=1 Tax=Rhynchophorus ferrugineus TaxID=354439 RepID=A0A834M8J7_RHYFE|nr:hypothetical protein GWI33_017963 [Rhynchophorus ferrugineus]
MSDVVKSVTRGDYLDITKSTRNVQAQEQEMKDCIEFLKIANEKYRQNKIILEAIEDCLDDENNLDDNLKNKIRSIILSQELSQISVTENTSELQPYNGVLGVPLIKCELTYSESNKLTTCLKYNLETKYQKLKKAYFSLLGKDFTQLNIKDIDDPLKISQEDEELMQYKKELIVEQESYISQQLQLLDLLDELKNFRLKSVPKLAEQKIDESKIRSKINYLKSLLTTEKCRVDVFMETSYSIKAYTELIKDIKDQQEELKAEIGRLTDLKKKYKHISSMEYNEILKSYLQYKSAFEKKKKIYECIHGKS